MSEYPRGAGIVKLNADLYPLVSAKSSDSLAAYGERTVGRYLEDFTAKVIAVLRCILYLEVVACVRVPVFAEHNIHLNKSSLARRRKSVA